MMMMMAIDDDNDDVTDSFTEIVLDVVDGLIPWKLK
jgi:hypothetical protein